VHPPGSARFSSLALAAIVSLQVYGSAHVVPPGRNMSLSGTVVAAATGRAIANAKITSYVSDAALAATTGADGGFTLGISTPGRYYLSATAPGYLPQSYGAEPEIRNTLVVVHDNQQVTGLEIRLHRGGTIAGTVTDDRGDPVAGVRVRPFIKRTVDGSAQFGQANGDATTDDRGAFRIVTQPAGEFLVAVTDGNRMTFAPSTPELARATGITLALDEVREGIQIRLPRDVTGTIEGSIAGLDGAFTRPNVFAIPDANRVLGQIGPIAAGPDGRFAIPDLSPGRYHLVLRPNAGQPPRFWADAPVVIATGASAPITLRAAGGIALSGTIESVGLRSLTIVLSPVGTDYPGAIPQSLRATATGSWSMAAVAPGRYRIDARISEQGDVLLSHKTPRLLDPGVHRLLATVTINGEDVTDRVVTIGDKPINDVRIRVTETAARITGHVRDAAGRITTAGAIVVAPADPRDWTPFTQRIKMARADTDGVYHVPLLPPGRYIVAHVASLAPGQLFDPAFLRTLGNARTVTLAPLDVVTMDVTIR